LKFGNPGFKLADLFAVHFGTITITAMRAVPSPQSVGSLRPLSRRASFEKLSF
jgi:hypothetical protein